MNKKIGENSFINKILDVKWIYSFFGLVLIFVISSFLSSSFMTGNNMLTILRQASILLMLSLGLTAVVLTGNIDLSVNSCAALTGCICAKLLVKEMPIFSAIFISMLVGIAAGMFNGLLVGVLKLPSFIATYGTNMVLSGIATIVMNGGVIYNLPSGFTNIGIGYVGPIPVPIIIAAGCCVVMVILLQKTTLGRNIYMYGHNHTASKYSGMKSLWTLIVSYILCGLTGAFGGIMMCARLNAADAGMSETYGLQIVAAVVVGGTSLLGGEGSVFGTIIGAIVLTAITNIMNILSVDSAWQNMVVGIVILLMVYVDVLTRNRRAKSAGWGETMDRTEQYKDIFGDLTLAARRAYRRGIQTGSGGNMSARIPGTEHMIVKNSGGSFADCTEQGKGWIAMKYDGTLLAGEKGKPTREWLLHAALLVALPEIGAVVHFHSPYTIAWAAHHDEIPQTTWHSGLKFGCVIPVVDIPAAVVPQEHMESILNLFRENPNLPAFVLRGHGLVAVGKNAVSAEHVAELVEETAQITVLEKLISRA